MEQRSETTGRKHISEAAGTQSPRTGTDTKFPLVYFIGCDALELRFLQGTGPKRDVNLHLRFRDL